MRLTVIGCSGSAPGADSPASCYLVEHDGFRLVLDLGNGALGALARYVDPLTIDAVLVSHLHADHCLDLVAYSYALRYHPAGPVRRVPVHGPAGLAERIEIRLQDYRRIDERFDAIASVAIVDGSAGTVVAGSAAIVAVSVTGGGV